MPRLSHSQINKWKHCRYCWYLEYVKKISVPQDMKYADAGNVLHHTIEYYYNNRTAMLQTIKDFFNEQWLHYKLDTTTLRDKKDAYWLMFLNAKNKEIELTSNEFKIFFNDFLCFIDGLNSYEDVIHDWKSSTYSQENVIEYTNQMKIYSWMYKRKFDKLPKACIVHYLKHADKIIHYVPTEKDIQDVENEINIIQKEMQEVIDGKIPIKCIHEGKECYGFCPYTDLCLNQGKIFTIHIMGAYIYVEGIDDYIIHRALHKKLSYELKNSYFLKRHNNLINTIVDFWKEKKSSTTVGFLEAVKETLENYLEYKKIKGVVSIKDHRVFNETKIDMPDKFINGKELRNYQLEAIEAFIKKKIAVIEAATGGGKTEIAIETIRRLGVRTLFVVNKIELLNQTKKRIEDSLGVKVGKIGQGEDDIQDITVATIQTLFKNKIKYREYLSTVRFVIFDECHHIASNSYYAITNMLNSTEYRMSISATVMRDDGEEMKIEAGGGRVCYRINARTLIDNGFLVEPTIEFVSYTVDTFELKNREDKYLDGLINETKDYNDLYKIYISENEWRNAAIVNLVDKHKGKKILILTRLIDHGKFLSEQFNCPHLTGETRKEEREKIMTDFLGTTNNVLVSTSSIWSEGIDCPGLEVIINASANKGDVKSIQMLGRVLRLFKGKNAGIFYDFMDYGQFFKYASFKRRKAFIKEGHTIRR